jgi:hypothetical protein
MKHLPKIFLITLFAINNLITKSQSSVASKIYVAQMATSCKETLEGGCSIFYYCVLKYEKDSAIVTYPTLKYCYAKNQHVQFSQTTTKKPKKYKWLRRNNKLTVKGFVDFQKYTFIEKEVDYFAQIIANSKDTNNAPIWHIYVDGKPYLEWVDAVRKVGNKWGITISIQANCGVGEEYKIQSTEADLKSQPAFNYLLNKYGTNWRAVFDKAVNEEMNTPSNKTKDTLPH